MGKDRKNSFRQNAGESVLKFHLGGNLIAVL